VPYIPKDKRKDVDFVVEDAIYYGIKPDGTLNYLLCRLCKRTIEPSYANYKNFIGELEEAAAEIRRRFLVPYEEKKIKENGDIL